MHCGNCIYHVTNHWLNPPLHICTKTMEIFMVEPYRVPPCYCFKHKPEYIPKEGE
jgi:hypothetical protein